MPGTVFINYRRSESIKDAGHLATLLERAFGKSRVFIDLKGLDGAADWLHELERQVARSRIMISVIGKDWPNIRDGRGNRRLEQDSDFVRFELAEAFRREIPVVPVLVDGALMPRPDELPQNLLLLTRPQAELLRAESFEADVAKIVLRIRRELARRRAGVSTWVATAGTVCAMMAGLAAAPLVLPLAGLGSGSGSVSADVSKQMAQQQEQTRSAVVARDAAQAEVAGLRQSLNATSATIKAAETARDSAQGEVKELRQKLNTAEAAAKAAEGKVAAGRDAAQVEINDLRQKLAAASSAAKAAEARLSQEVSSARKERDELAGALKKAEQEIARRDTQLKGRSSTQPFVWQDEETEPPKEAQARVDSADVRTLTRSIQTRLKELQCFDSNPTGFWGPVTTAAAARFNTANKPLTISEDRATPESLNALGTPTVKTCTAVCKEIEVFENGKCAPDQSLEVARDSIRSRVDGWRGEVRKAGCLGKKSAQVVAQGWWPWGEIDVLLNNVRCRSLIKQKITSLERIVEDTERTLEGYQCLEFFLFSKTLRRGEKCDYLAAPYNDAIGQLNEARKIVSPGAPGTSAKKKS